MSDLLWSAAYQEVLSMSKEELLQLYNQLSEEDKEFLEELLEEQTQRP